ncbi:MAG: hypothetical protein A2252_07785 [Elusimicrobia bacterium RIFOXYA2_FULL_39_19]|nr:MAG: hypothetical protein A2252_07785 [Elusimicrobia bacterium RIFOXYA2_FULL_39_19]
MEKENVFVVRGDGGCMRPFINNGDFLFFKKTTTYYPGDVVCYEHSSRKFVHRIKSISGSTAIINDDRGITADHSVELDCILGKHIGGINGAAGLYLNKLLNRLYNFFFKRQQNSTDSACGDLQNP